MSSGQIVRLVGNTQRDFSGKENKPCAFCGAVFHRDTRNTWKHWDKARFCSRSCSARWQAQQTESRRLPKKEEFSRWHSRGDGCWLWLGGLSHDGYGAFNYEGKTYRAHRIALELDGRSVPTGMMACHRCDTPACVNPAHLYAGTPSENVRDMMDRGRHASQRRAS